MAIPESRGRLIYRTARRDDRFGPGWANPPKVRNRVLTARTADERELPDGATSERRGMPTSAKSRTTLDARRREMPHGAKGGTSAKGGTTGKAAAIGRPVHRPVHAASSRLRARCGTTDP